MFSRKKEQTTYNVAMGRSLKHIMVSDRNRAQKATYGMIPSIWPSTKGQTTKKEIINRVWGQGEGTDPKGHMGTFWYGGDVPDLDCGHGYATV